MVQITKSFHFSAAHRLEGHPKCGRLHGHNYQMDVTVRRVQGDLNPLGFVIDFGDLKRVVKEAFLDLVDHRYMVSDENVRRACPFYEVAISPGPRQDPDHVVQLPIPQTSAEYLSGFFAGEITKELFTQGYDQVRVAKVRVWETPTSYGEYEG